MLAIPFVSDTAASLFSEEPINDLYYILRLLIDAKDLLQQPRYSAVHCVAFRTMDL